MASRNRAVDRDRMNAAPAVKKNVMHKNETTQAPRQVLKEISNQKNITIRKRRNESGSSGSGSEAAETLTLDKKSIHRKASGKRSVAFDSSKSCGAYFPSLKITVELPVKVKIEPKGVTSTNEKENKPLKQSLPNIDAVNNNKSNATSAPSSENSSYSQQTVCTSGKTNGFSMFRFQGPQKQPFDEDFNYVPEYLEDINEYLLQRDNRSKLGVNYLSNSLITPRMRSVLIDWLVKVGCHFDVVNETVHIATNLTDSFLKINGTITRNILQLVGITAFFIAYKYEEVIPRNIADFSQITGNNVCSREDIKAMERFILKTVEFEVAPPTSIFFFRRAYKIATKSNKYDLKDLYHCGTFILELALVDYDGCSFSRSLLGYGALALSLMIINLDLNLSVIWDQALQDCTYLSLTQLMPVIFALNHIVLRAIHEPKEMVSVRNKFTTEAYNNISASLVMNPGRWRNRVFEQLQRNFT